MFFNTNRSRTLYFLIKKRFLSRSLRSKNFEEMTAKKPSHKFKLTVIGCGSKGSPKAVCLVADHNIYLFNCGDGTNKLFLSLKSVNSTRLDHIFLTHVNWDNIGGVYGKSLTAIDMEGSLNSQHVTIHNGNQVKEILKHSIMFAEERLFSSSLSYRDLSDGTFTDDNVIIDYVPLTHAKLRKLKDRTHKKFVVKKCHLKRGANKSFGFVLMTLNTQTGFYVGKVEPGSSADLTGMCHGDRIVEINGQSVSQFSYSDVVDLIRNCKNEIKVLVVDKDCDEYCVENELVVSSTMAETDMLAVEERDETYSESKSILSDKPLETRPVIAYIVQFQPDQGKVKGHVLKELGIKGGPFIKKIFEGESVTVNGTLLTPELLLEKPQAPRPMLVVDCVSEDYLDSLMESEQICILNNNPDTVPQIIVHFTPASLINHPKYKEFMKRYESDMTYHLMINKNCPITLQEKLNKRQAVFHSVHPEIFPQLHCDKIVPQHEGSVVQGVYALDYILKPKGQTGFKWNHVSTSSNKDMIQQHFDDLLHQDLTKQLLNMVHERIDKQEIKTDGTKEYPVMNFLGTGSALPSRYRSQSFILVETCKDEFIILDCGEGALMHLYIMFGEKRAEEILCNLKGVFLSHLHYDHIGGIIAVGLKRQQLLAKQGRQNKLTMIAPAKMKKWLAHISANVISTDSIFNFIPMANVQANRGFEFTDSTLRHIQRELNMKQFTAIPVDHVLGSFGVYFQHSDGWTMLYSGDTRPCPLLVKYGYGKTDYLIHEGTFSTSETKMAYEKKHSTVGQAISIGKQMKAHHTVLTHFSQRYANNPPFEDLEDGVAFAYDFMQLKPKHIPVLSFLKPAFALLFQDNKQHLNSRYIDDVLYSLAEQNIDLKRNSSDTEESGAPNCKEQKLEDGMV